MPSAPDETVELVLGAGVAAGGDGIGRLPDGRVVFVEGALPGETVTATLIELRRDYAKARRVDVLAAAPGRVTPPCPERMRGCGGCGWQHIAPEVQVELKERIVGDALRRVGRLSGSPPPATVPLPASGYRTTVHLGVDRQGRPSYHRHRSHDLLAPASCLVAHPRLEELIVGCRVPGADRVTLRVGVAGGERLAVVERRLRRGVELPPGAMLVGPGGRGALHEDAGGRRWRVSARSFFQAGPGVAGALADAVDRAVGDAGRRLVDLYAGVGLLGGVVAGRRGGTLVAVEHSPAAAGDARHNLADLDATVVVGEVGEWEPVDADAVIADPARSGLGRPGVAAVAATGAAVLVLVSCDPASLGRDAALLIAGGWRLAGLTLVDAFPHTPHVECVTRFDR